MWRGVAARAGDRLRLHRAVAIVVYRNISEDWHQESISQQGNTSTACGGGDGRIPFCSAEDIAAVAFRALVDEKPNNMDYRILDPEMLIRDQLSAWEKLGRAISPSIENVKLTREQRENDYGRAPAGC
ncbi:hypothetical protein B0J12DRAFT_695207 [Macrophomina phaseolina]|uniref:Uncharacterized protein n=1 Tax=Macrophomina phaseolina TaxID=35725 RepID=A0ABQ8GRL7_9PEZI|nr:hypothetical protein B0J12DRAFT_695207 [Macrophomina phaseolina]